MLAGRPLRKLRLALIAAAPLAASAGELEIALRAPWLVPALIGIVFPPPPPPVPSQAHLGVAPGPRERLVPAGAVAIDARTFVAGGVHYRLAGVAPAPPGSVEEAVARRALQARLDAARLAMRIVAREPSGVRLVELAPGG